MKNCLLAATLSVVGTMTAVPATAAEAQKGKEAGDITRDRLRDQSCQDASSAAQFLEKILKDNDCAPRQRQRQPEKEKERSNKP